MRPRRHDEIRKEVRARYARIAAGATSGCGCATPSCCSASSTSAKTQSARLGYSAEELTSAPDGANLGLGCGNPQALAQLRRGETVVDLGAGGGFDCFLAARQVGRRGRVIGVDMTPEMVTRARENARKGGYANVEFRLGEIEHLPVADGTADVVLSNCVINLSPDKRQVFREIHRILKPGGRVAVSDVVAIRPIPAAVRRDLDKHSGCVSGAATVRAVRRMLHSAGLRGIRVAVKEESAEFIKDWFPGNEVERYVRSALIEARKSGG